MTYLTREKAKIEAGRVLALLNDPWEWDIYTKEVAHGFNFFLQSEWLKLIEMKGGFVFYRVSLIDYPDETGLFSYLMLDPNDAINEARLHLEKLNPEPVEIDDIF
jgi:hypothetical protein